MGSYVGWRGTAVEMLEEGKGKKNEEPGKCEINGKLSMKPT